MPLPHPLLVLSKPVGHFHRRNLQDTAGKDKLASLVEFDDRRYHPEVVLLAVQLIRLAELVAEPLERVSADTVEYHRMIPDVVDDVLTQLNAHEYIPFPCEYEYHAFHSWQP